MIEIALTRPPSASLARCELTYLEREPIDLERARCQHEAYEAVLAALGRRIVRLPVLDEHPDAVFVEDAAIALDELAIVAPMGAASRAGESATVEAALARALPVRHLDPPATLDGGDVMRVERRLFVGVSRRTNIAAVEQLARMLRPYEYEVVPVSVTGALHLKSACSHIGGGAVLANLDWIDARALGGVEVVRADSSEPWGASVLRVDDTLVMPAGFPRTRALLRARGLTVNIVDLSELRKAEGGPTCLSILVSCRAFPAASS
jgi:dimethylargininase